LHTDRARRRAAVDAAVATAFAKARGLHGSPHLVHDLRDAGWTVSEKTVADSMRRHGLVARRIKRRNGLTVQDKAAPKFPDLLRRDFTADRPNTRWVGDMTEIPTGVDGARHEAIPGDRDRSVLASSARRRYRAAPGRRAGLRGDQHGRRDAWREGGDLA